MVIVFDDFVPKRRFVRLERTYTADDGTVVTSGQHLTHGLILEGSTVFFYGTVVLEPNSRGGKDKLEDVDLAVRFESEDHMQQYCSFLPYNLTVVGAKNDVP
jgi:hypothetical protein